MDRLPGRRIVVVSPHLDDAVLSLGATLRRSVSEGAEVTVLTVLGNDPDSSAPAGFWDGDAGFRTEGEAVRGRREEDRAACDMVGATTAWLPFGDMQYERHGTDGEIASSISESIESADLVLVPGFPLAHPDHAHVARLALGLGFPGTMLLFLEQPYVTTRHPFRPWTWPYRPGLAEPLADVVAEPPRWRTIKASIRERRQKLLACKAYPTQLPLIGRRPPILWRMALYESIRGGETVGSIRSRNHRS